MDFEITFAELRAQIVLVAQRISTSNNAGDLVDKLEGYRRSSMDDATFSPPSRERIRKLREEYTMRLHEERAALEVLAKKFAQLGNDAFAASSYDHMTKEV